MIALLPLARPAEVLLWAAPLPGESEFVLEDPLALDYLGQQVGYFLLPALATRSGQAQYFAMVLYGLDLAERALKVARAAASSTTTSPGTPPSSSSASAASIASEAAFTSSATGTAIPSSRSSTR